MSKKFIVFGLVAVAAAWIFFSVAARDSSEIVGAGRPGVGRGGAGRPGVGSGGAGRPGVGPGSAGRPGVGPGGAGAQERRQGYAETQSAFVGQRL